MVKQYISEGLDINIDIKKTEMFIEIMCMNVCIMR